VFYNSYFWVISKQTIAVAIFLYKSLEANNLEIPDSYICIE